MSNKLGTSEDDYQFRQTMLGHMSETNKLLAQLQQSIEDYDSIAVVFAQIRQKNDKHRAFAQKLAELS